MPWLGWIGLPWRQKEKKPGTVFLTEQPAGLEVCEMQLLDTPSQWAAKLNPDCRSESSVRQHTYCAHQAVSYCLSGPNCPFISYFFLYFLGCLATRWRLNSSYLIQNNKTRGHMAGPGVSQLYSHDISNGKVYGKLRSKRDVLLYGNRLDPGPRQIWTRGFWLSCQHCPAGIWQQSQSFWRVKSLSGSWAEMFWLTVKCLFKRG